MDGCAGVSYNPAGYNYSACRPYKTVFNVSASSSQPSVVLIPQSPYSAGYFGDNDVCTQLALDGLNYTTKFGSKFTVHCGQATAGNTNLISTFMPSAQDCMEHCALYPTCIGVGFGGAVVGSNSTGTANCYPLSAQGTVPHNSTTQMYASQVFC